MSSHTSAQEELLTLLDDYHSLNPDDVLVLPTLPTAIDFCKQVSRGLPQVYQATESIKSHAAWTWTRETLINAVGDSVIEVAATPDGRADSLYPSPDAGNEDEDERVFLQPANIEMSMADFFRKLDAVNNSQSNDTDTDTSTNTIDNEPVYYLQSQNSNLTTTPLSPLLSDLPNNFPFAEPVLGSPEAINIWIGDDRSVTSTHRDPYENLYVVLRGSKTFTLWPPVDEICMDAQLVRTGRYTYCSDSRSFSVVLDEQQQHHGGQSGSDVSDDADEDGTDDCASLASSSSSLRIPWVPIDPHLPRSQLNALHPLYKYARPRTVTVQRGQMLYLPSGWYHHVAQSCGEWDDGTKAPCIAVNYWYDMEYEGEKYAMRQLIGRMVQGMHSEKSSKGARQVEK